MAERHLHVPAPEARAAVHGRVHGRLLEVHRGIRDRAPPEEHAGDRGPEPRHRRLRVPEGDPDGQRAAVHGVAGRNRLRAGAGQAGDPPREEQAAAPGDGGEARAVVEDAVGRIPFEDGLRGLRRLPAAGEAVRGPLQLQAAAPGARGDDSCRPLLRVGAAGARSDRACRGGERARAGHAAARAQALLPGGACGRPGPDDSRGRRRAARADGVGAADDDTDRKGGRRWRRDQER